MKEFINEMLAILPSLSLVFVLSPPSIAKSYLERLPARRAVAPQLCAVDQKGLYSKIERVLTRAKRDGAPALNARTARALSQRWLELSPAALVEATFVSGALILEGFDEGFEILLEAEEVAACNVSAKAYYALCRMALAEERSLDVLALLARTRGRDVPRTEGLLLVAMEAAANLEDWGGVARLYSELTDGPEEAAKLAVALESFGSAAVLEELQRPRAREHDSPARSPETQRALALTLALRAHAERGDVNAATEVLESLRARAAPLGLAEYAQLWRLARRTGRPEPLLALRFVDVRRSAQGAIEPTVLGLANRARELAATLGTTERALVLGLAGVLVAAAAIAAVASALTPPPLDPLDF